MHVSHRHLEGCLDPALLQDLADLDPGESVDSLGLVLRSFAESSPELLEGIAAGADRADAVRVGRHAHALKGSARTIGATRLGDACERLEQGAGWDETAVGQVVSAHHQVMVAIRTWLSSVEQGAPEAGGSGRRILVIDDDPVLATSIKRQLSGHDVVIAASASEALLRLGGQHFDAVLCDLQLGDRSGRDVHEQSTRADPALAARFIFLTGGVTERELAAYLRRTGSPVLMKPVDRAVLLEAIDRVADQRDGSPLPR